MWAFFLLHFSFFVIVNSLSLALRSPAKNFARKYGIKKPKRSDCKLVFLDKYGGERADIANKFAKKSGYRWYVSSYPSLLIHIVQCCGTISLHEGGRNRTDRTEKSLSRVLRNNRKWYRHLFLWESHNYFWASWFLKNQPFELQKILRRFLIIWARNQYQS